MTIDSGSHRTGHLSAHTSLVGVEVLVLDADKGVHDGIAQLLSEASLHVTCVCDAERALALVQRQFFSVALVDSAGTVLAGNYASYSDSSLISPAFTVPASSSYPRLRFWQSRLSRWDLERLPGTMIGKMG